MNNRTTGRAAAAPSASLDVVIPCFNAAATLARAVASAASQKPVARIWLVDDGSTDETAALAQALVEAHAGKVRLERLAENRGAAHARNLGAFRSQAEVVAFLDADDAYQPQALEPASFALAANDNLALVRLGLVPVGMPDAYRLHPEFPKAWRTMEMTGAGNLVIRRRLLLACGGFPEHPLFRRLGGEDAALGNALHGALQYGVLFGEAGVLYHYRPGSHVERLMRLVLFGENPAQVGEEDRAQARVLSAEIASRLASLRALLNQAPAGSVPLTVEWGPPGANWPAGQVQA